MLNNLCYSEFNAWFWIWIWKVKKVPLADNTMGRHIIHISETIACCIKDIIRNNNASFALQFDESTYVNRWAELSSYVFCTYEDKIVQQYLCRQEIPLNTKGLDIFKVFNDYMKENNLLWNNFMGSCTDSKLCFTPSFFTKRSKVSWISIIIGSGVTCQTRYIINLPLAAENIIFITYLIAWFQ